MRRLLLAVSILTLGLVATPGVALATHSPASQREVVGEYNGAKYALFLPYRWNGDLVVYAHGFIDPVAPIALPDVAPIEVAPWVVELRERLLQAGYGVAYSSYSENGWAVNDGAQRTREMRPLFDYYFSKPDKTYVIGRSLGALTTMLLVEKYSTESSSSLNLLGLISTSSTERVIDGALALCGPVGGGRKQTDYVAHTRALFDVLYPGVIPGDVLHVQATNYASDSPQVQAIVGSILTNPNAAVALASADQIELPWTSFPELINTIVRVLGYNILGTNDLLERTGRTSPFENRSTTYTGLGAYDATVNAGVDRFAGSTQAFNYLKAFYQPKGDLKVPVLTLHTTLDPDVPFSHEQALKNIVVKYTGDSTPNKLAQQHYNRYGHCNFTPAETADAFFRLANWVERGVKPANGALAP
jgi:pimeloyl-ACP methyl ester carboxylesterase